MSDTLFDTPATTPAEQVTTPPSDAFANQLLAIQNEKGEPKYDSLTKALEALKHSQDYIPQLKGQNEQLLAELERTKAELAKAGSVEEIISRFTAQKQEVPAQPPLTQEPAALDESKVQELLLRTLTQRDKEQTAQANLNLVRSALTERFGEKAKEAVSAKAADFGMTDADIVRLASTSPAAVLAWFGAQAPTTTSAPLKSTVTLPELQSKAPLGRPDKSMLRGASSKDQVEFMRKIRDEVYAKHNITS